MRKFTVILFLTALFASCNDSDRYYREPAPDTGMQKKIVDLTIQSKHWEGQVDENGNFIQFFCEMEMPELTLPIFNEGLYHTYYVWRDGNVTVQQALPHIIFHEETDDIGNPYRWTETISCDYSPGFMQFHVRYSDFYDEKPPTMNFRFIVLM